jgi:hypothetical protein
MTECKEETILDLFARVVDFACRKILQRKHDAARAELTRRHRREIQQFRKLVEESR